MSSIVIGVDAGPEKSEYDDKDTFLPRDFSLFTSVILFCILNIRSGQNKNMVQNQQHYSRNTLFLQPDGLQEGETEEGLWLRSASEVKILF